MKMLITEMRHEMYVKSVLESFVVLFSMLRLGPWQKLFSDEGLEQLGLKRNFLFLRMLVVWLSSTDTGRYKQ